MLIVWDRLVGAFAAEGPAIVHRFGVTGYDADAANPVGVASHEWRRILGMEPSRHSSEEGGVPIAQPPHDSH